MTPPRRAALLAAGLLAGAGAVVALRRRHEAPAPPPGPRALACAFVEGAELAYRVEVARGEDGGADALRATLRVRALARVARGEWLLGARVDPLAGFPHPERLREPFALRIGRNCRFEGFAWPAGTTAAQAEAVTRLLQPFEVVLGDGAAARWSASHDDGNGTYLADYSVAEGSWAAPAITREAHAYLQRAAGGSVSLVDLRGRFVLDGEGQWLRSLRGHTTHRVAAAPRGLTVRLSLSLDRVAALAGPALPTLDEARAYHARRPAAPSDDDEAHRARLERARARAAGMESLSAEAALAQALALFDGDQDPMHERAFQHLLGWLLARPEAAAELLARLRAGQVEDRLHALLFLALEQSDTPAARRALIAAVDDDGISPMNRQRASLALGAMHTPSVEAVAALRDASRAGGRGDDAEMSRGVALRSLGQLAGDAVPAEVSGEARAVIREALQSRDAVLRRGGLDAAGNARSESFLPELSTALDDADARTRAAAAHGLRGVPRETAQPLLAARLAREEDRDVRAELATTLTENARGAFDDATVRAAASALPRSPEAPVRAQVIRLLGAAAPTHALAREALAAWVPRETQPELLQLIGQYLDLPTMREALRRRAAHPP